VEVFVSRTILNAGLLDLLREVTAVVEKKCGYGPRRFWKELLVESELICLGRKTVDPKRLAEIEKTITQGVSEYGIEIRREPCVGS
jgi:hypothetical protein